MRRELLSEELRVLYVALTRAKEKLFLIGSCKDHQKQLAKWQASASQTDWLLPEFDRYQARTYLDFIGPALARHRDLGIWLVCQHTLTSQVTRLVLPFK